MLRSVLVRRMALLSFALSILPQAYGQPFARIVSIPPDADIGDNRSIGFQGFNTQFNLSDGGTIGDRFDVGESGVDANIEVNIAGGTVGELFRIRDGVVVNISGGTVGNEFFADVFSRVNITGGAIGADSGTLRAEVNITGGAVGDSFRAGLYTLLNISGGSIGDGFEAIDYSEVNVRGGSIGDGFYASKAVVNIFGGSIGDGFVATDNVFGDSGPGSDVNIYGTEFVLDGVDITPTLGLFESLVIDERDVTLRGLLADGSAFSFDLNSQLAEGQHFFERVEGQDFFDVASTLTVTLVPEPSSALLLTVPVIGGFYLRRCTLVA